MYVCVHTLFKVGTGMYVCVYTLMREAPIEFVCVYAHSTRIEK